MQVTSKAVFADTDTDTDISGESTEVQGIASAVWTTTVKNAKKAANENAGI